MEFAILAPIFLLMFVFMVDLGLAIYQKMSLDRLLRSTSQFIMAEKGSERNIDQVRVKNYLDGSASFFVLSGQEFDVLSAEHFFTCDLAPGTTEFNTPEIAEDNCPDSDVFEHYRLGATMLPYRGLFVGNVQIPFAGGALQAGADGLQFSSTLQIQIQKE